MPEGSYTFVYGDDDFLVDARARAEFAKISEGIADDLSKEIVDGAASNLDDVQSAVSRFLSAVQTVSLFQERKAVWFRGVSFLGATRTGDSEGAKEEVARLIEGLKALDPQAVGVVISACPVDKRKTGFKTLAAQADAVEISADDAAPERLFAKAAAEYGASIDATTADYLFQKLHGNTRLCIEETHKLALAVADEKPARITAALVDDLVPDFGESDFFEPVSAFYANDLPKTLESVKRYFFTRKEARPLLANFQTRNRALIQMRALLDAGEIRLRGSWLDNDTFASAKNRFGSLYDDDDKTSVFRLNPRALGFFARDASRFKLKTLINFQNEFRAAFEDAVRRPKEHEAVVREMVIRCLGAGE